jgi:hypothetical protein
MEDNLKEMETEIKTEDKIKKLEEEILALEIKLEENQKEVESAEANFKNAKKRLQVRLNNKELLEGKKAKKELEIYKIKEIAKEENNIQG